METKITPVTLNLPNLYSQQALTHLGCFLHSPSFPASFSAAPWLLLITEMSAGACCRLGRLIVANELDFYANNNLEGFILFPYKYKSDPKAAARRQQRWERRAPRRNKAAREQTDVGSRFFCWTHLANSTFEPVLFYSSSLLVPFSDFILKCLYVLHVQAEIGRAVLSSCSSNLLWGGLHFPVNQNQGIHQCPQSPRREGLSLPTNLSGSSKGCAPTLVYP